MNQEQTMNHNPEENIQRLEREFDVLRSDVKSQKTTWYRNASTLISLVALVLSGLTTYYSYQRLVDQDIQNRKVELRGLLQRLAALPREYVNAVSTDKKDHALIATISSSVGQESTMISRQALELARNLPRKDVSASEWFTIGVALRGDLKYEEAKEVFGYALESAGGLIEKVAVMRATADLLYTMDRIPAGRSEYERALDVFSQFRDYGDRTKNEIHIQTYLSWAYSEASLGIENNKKINEHLDEAEALTLKIPPGRRTEDIKTMIAEARKELNNKNEPAAPPLAVKSSPKSGAADNTTLIPGPLINSQPQPEASRGSETRRPPRIPREPDPQRVNTNSRGANNRNRSRQSPQRRRGSSKRSV